MTEVTVKPTLAASRRSLLKGSALAGAAAALPLASSTAHAAARLVVYDSRVAESRDFAAQHRGGLMLDMAVAHDDRFALLRGDLPAITHVEGLTRWSDWLMVRGAMEERGLRLASETRIAAPLTGRDHLFRWALRSR
ncbi:twin-arginine translocation signal domain-containing protein [Novosphingobium sp. FSY-8]|uniref:Twin-arginine translocation signal domain-containing protein n=1 Tax=Novosphingobium ovatum TaxID=1908523 RepID=A0ABW9XDE3_9SPHN|nr:twin-arginine translocation signal domain-containing protein [Novosphingobium ovatum]NBC36561.1 twin-arginine translocation signal domain-containing protein [Novosphingobium ovatum]